MNKTLITLAVAIAALTALTACHTTEENFKKAYDTAVAKTIDNEGQQYHDKMVQERMRPTEVVGGDSVRIVRTYGNIADDKPDKLHKFNVVVAEFDQIINARSYKQRLHDREGYEPYLIFNNQSKKYCVIVKGFDEKGPAAAFVTNIKSYMKMKVLVPRAWILQLP